MDAKLRTGLIAGGIVAFFGLLVGGATVVVFMVPSVTGQTKSSLSTGGLFAPLPSSTGNDVLQKIASHSFWKKSLTTADVKELVAKLQMLPGDRAAFVDQSVRFAVIGNNETAIRPVLLDYQRLGWNVIKPDTIVGNYFVYDTLSDTTRPEEDEVAARVLRLLDKAVFRP